MSAVILQLLAAGAPDTTPPTITSANSDSVAEDTPLAHALTANESVSWSIVGGADQAQFQLSGATLQWISNGTQDFEAPADANADNAYIVTVRATDGSSNTTDQTITVTVTDLVATWDPAAVTAVTLSGGNLVATNTGTTSADQGAHGLSSNALSAGKYYIEFTDTTHKTGGNYGVGVGTAVSSYTNIGTSATTGALEFLGTGNIWANGSNTGKTLGGRASGDVIGAAIDLDNRKIWFKKVSGTPGNWNGDAAANPATNTGGVTIPAGAMVPFVTFGGTSGLSGAVLTLNVGDTGFTGSAPSGFASGWPH